MEEGVFVGVLVSVLVVVAVFVAVGVLLGVFVGVAVFVGVFVAVDVSVGVCVAVAVAVFVATNVAVQVAVGVDVVSSVDTDIDTHVLRPSGIGVGVRTASEVGGSALSIWPANSAFWALAGCIGRTAVVLAEGRVARIRNVIRVRTAIVSVVLVRLDFIADSLLGTVRWGKPLRRVDSKKNVLPR